MKKSNHARLQSIMNRFNPSIPEPCCVPDKMMPLSILFFDSENRDHIVLKVFPNMAVASCACRWLAAFKFCLYKCILSILYILYTIYQNAMWLIQIYYILLKWVIINDSIRTTTQNERVFFSLGLFYGGDETENQGIIRPSNQSSLIWPLFWSPIFSTWTKSSWLK